jgi:enoyl-[acyl-carrier protein] reductase II
VLRNRATRDPRSTTPVTIGATTLFPGVLDVPYTMPKHSAIVPTRDTTGDLDEMDMPAGSTSVLAVRRVRPAEDIIEDFIASGREACDRDDGPDDDASLDED